MILQLQLLSRLGGGNSDRLNIFFVGGGGIKKI